MGEWSEFSLGITVTFAWGKIMFHSVLHNALSRRAPLKVVRKLPQVLHVNISLVNPMSLRLWSRIHSIRPMHLLLSTLLGFEILFALVTELESLTTNHGAIRFM